VTDTFMIVTGCNEDGNFINIMDAGWIENMVTELSSEYGLGEDNHIRGVGAQYKI
jgi:2,4'-dihydroxyacetophenone dioxygenase